MWCRCSFPPTSWNRQSWKLAGHAQQGKCDLGRRSRRFHLITVAVHLQATQDTQRKSEKRTPDAGFQRGRHRKFRQSKEGLVTLQWSLSQTQVLGLGGRGLNGARLREDDS